MLAATMGTPVGINIAGDPPDEGVCPVLADLALAVGGFDQLIYDIRAKLLRLL
jgi:hypothetical protein